MREHYALPFWGYGSGLSEPLFHFLRNIFTSFNTEKPKLKTAAKIGIILALSERNLKSMVIVFTSFKEGVICRYISRHP